MEKKKNYQKPDMKTIMLDYQPLLQNISGGSEAPKMRLEEDE